MSTTRVPPPRAEHSSIADWCADPRRVKMATMEERPFEIRVLERTADSLILAVSGEVDVSSADRLAAALVDSGDTNICVDLSEVSFLDSTALRVLLTAHQRADENNMKLELRDPQAGPRKVLEITGFFDQLVAKPVADPE